MHTMFLSAALFMFFLVIPSTKADHCKEDDLRNCVSELQQLLEEEYKFVQKTDEELNEYCVKVENESGCLKDVTDVCKKEHPLIAALSVILYNHLNKVCGKNRKQVYMNMLSCSEVKEKTLAHCSDVKISGKIEDPQLKNACLDMKAMLCVADATKTLCGDDGKKFAESLEYGIKDEYHEVCSGMEWLTANVLTLVFSLCLVILLIKNF